MDTRCTAPNRQGHRCGRRPIIGGTVCKMHGGGAPQVQQKAAERMRALAPKAVQTFDVLMSLHDFPTVQLGAARYVYDQAEGTALERVEQKHSGTVVYRHELAD